ncbi:hypothetical protein M0E87_01490 [Corynebacterium sp. CCM 9185]|uniref:Uncharacterized protein n=1 Tax=Corynebacterium marambiense TaxID=2765364 RepID=A0ABS0VT80_9CORY|nr:hypothetical protein [Corynebacterium marambiense]MBI8999509.1 hypothetical protein [Corynebacterium marambiense]MCK7662347.1 hypothetical protein [Corynebacterium marambiense]
MNGAGCPATRIVVDTGRKRPTVDEHDDPDTGPRRPDRAEYERHPGRRV